MAAQLAPIFLDNNRVVLQGDPKPNVSKIVTNAGKRPGKVQVVRLEAQDDTEGAPLRDNDVIDRTMETNPIYLHALEVGGPSSPLPDAPSKSGVGTPSFEGQPSVAKPANPTKQPWKQTAQEEPETGARAAAEEAEESEEE